MVWWRWLVVLNPGPVIGSVLADWVLVDKTQTPSQEERPSAECVLHLDEVRDGLYEPK